MAQIGLRHFKYSPIGTDGGYTGAKKLAGAIEIIEQAKRML